MLEEQSPRSLVKESLQQRSKRQRDKNVWLKTPNSDAKRKFCILGPPLPSQRGLSFLPSKSILPPTQGSRPSGKFQQECKLRDVYKTEINFIKWPPVWSPGRHSTQTFPLWAKECCLHLPLRMGCWDQESSFQVYSSRSALWRIAALLLTAGLTQISGKFHVEGPRTLGRLDMHNIISQSQ